MTDTIEQKALALIKPGATCEVNLENISILAIALTRAIEQHEAFRQEVSDALLRYHALSHVPHGLQAFIIAKPDPLVEALEEWINSRDLDDAASFRAAIEKRGGKIVWGEG